MVLNTLSVIQDKIRKVTARPQISQISNEEINLYINTFLLYDFPEHMRLRSLQTNYTFVTSPNVEKYSFPVEQFVSLDSPAFVGGYRVGFYQDQSIFYSTWPKLNFFQQIGTGDGSASPTLSNMTNVPAIADEVTLSTTIGGTSVSYLDNGSGSFLEQGIEIASITQSNPANVTVTSVSF